MRKGRVKLDVPPLIDNGNSVVITVSVESPMTAADHVKAIHVFAGRIPQPNVVSVYSGPRAGTRRVSRRAFASPTRRSCSRSRRLSDGSFWSDGVEVIVTLSACVEER